jgi:aspartyl/asparaginyl beta-hydroxylase (cupin superfamily)
MSEHNQTVALLQQAEEARRHGDDGSAARLWRQVLELDPDSAVALNGLGMQALARNDPEAGALFARATQADPAAAALWMNLATARRRDGDLEGERLALEGALATDQRHLMANVRLAELHERADETNSAAFRWSGVVEILQKAPDRSPALEAMLEHARTRLAGGVAKFAGEVEGGLAELRTEVPAVERRRFDTCIDAMLGRRTIYRHQPHGLHFPFLPADEFFPREHFPWMPALEAAAPAIRRELETLLAAPHHGFSPYVEMTPGSPVNEWTPLDRSDDWSALYLWKYGERRDSACARCPETVAALERTPLADMPGKGPTVFFSILRPGARLPAHTGVSNVRSIVHLPLIVPPGCGFRVGGETRQWEEGRAFAFDDTIEHEAWNQSSSIRAVLIFDVWNPHLTETEKAMLRALFTTLGGMDDVPAAVGAVAD